MATVATSKGQRVTRIRSLRTFVTVWNPMSGRNRPNATKAVTPASRRARVISTRPPCAPSSMSDLLDIGPAKQPLRQEDQCDRQHGKSSDVLVVNGKICRPHG